MSINQATHRLCVCVCASYKRACVCSERRDNMFIIVCRPLPLLWGREGGVLRVSLDSRHYSSWSRQRRSATWYVPPNGHTLLDDGGLELLSQLLAYAPASRPTAEGALRHAYFRTLASGARVGGGWVASYVLLCGREQNAKKGCVVWIGGGQPRSRAHPRTNHNCEIVQCS